MTPEIAALNVLRRVLGYPAERFSLHVLDSSAEAEYFELSAKGGQVEVAGSSASALCRGAYHYLKAACHVQVSWSGGEVRLPERLPDFDKISVVCPHQLRFYMTVCTFGYSTVWWDWARWEREIDWMAVHGINMPLAMVGQEFVWQRVFVELGLSEAEILSHFSGPAFLPWHRMGNLNGYMGPLSQSWMDVQAKLQRRILDRQRELGMMPVVPGFSGFVPAAFNRVHPEVELHSAEPWAGFDATTYIDPRSEMFAEIGTRFVKEYKEAFGPVHHYLCDTFAEQVPRIESNKEIEYLKALGASTWKGLVEGDPDCHWVMQGWPFFFAPEYWSLDRAEAFLGAVPTGKLIVIDQIMEEFEVWRKQPIVREKGWVHTVVHNYGQTTHLHGNLSAFVERAWNAFQAPDHGNMLGMGIVPEGIDQNPVVYELMTDIIWRSDRTDISSWLEEYAHSRYGVAAPSALIAWKLLHSFVYGPEGAPTLDYCWRFRPADQSIARQANTFQVFEAAKKLLTAAPELGGNRLFQRDLIDVAKTSLGGLADLVLAAALTACNQRSEVFAEHRLLFVQILLDMDRLLATLPEHRLSTWITAARSAAKSPEEADHFEINARLQVTYWGKPFLFDYATKEWAGLTKGFHLERWHMYFEYLERHHRGEDVAIPDFGNWEEDWAHKIRPVLEAPYEDPSLVATELIGKYALQTEIYERDHGCLRSRLYGPMSAVSESDSSKLTLLLDLESQQRIQGLAIFPIFGQGLQGTYVVELSTDGKYWETVPGEALSTYRGARRRFAQRAVRFIRFVIDRILGEPDHPFQVLTFWDGNQTLDELFHPVLRPDSLSEDF